MNQTSLHELGLMVAEGFNNLVVIEQSNEWLKEQDLTSEAERFELWAKNLGLFADGHASLDYRLRDATFVKDRFEELFRDLIEHLKELAMILKGERKPAEELDFPQDDSSSSGSSTKSSVLTRPAVSSGGDSFHEIDFRFQSLTDKINSLYRLATRIRNPKNRPSRTIDQLFEHIPEHDRLAHLRALERFETNIISYLLRQNIIEASSRESFRTDHAMSLEDILKQYAEPDCWIVRRAGKANARRKRQLAYWKEHALRLGQVKEKPIKSARPSPSESHITPGQHMSLSALGGQQKALPSLATSATKLPVIKPGDLKSVISHQSRVSTIMNVQQHDLNWPPPPAIPAQAQFFECLYCKVLCSKKYIEKGSWETHIIHDLKAYHCTYEQCQDPNRLYGSKQEWLNHESQHNLVWFCQDDEEEFETQPDYVHHFEAKHSEFRADRLPELLMSTAMTSSKQVHRSCPFCPTGFTDVVEMQKHIALHLVRLALLAIAPLDDDTTHNGESMQLPTTDQPQRLGRVRSIIGDFGIKHGLQKIPCDTLLVGSRATSYRPDQLLVFYDCERSILSICFKETKLDLDHTLLSESCLFAFQASPGLLSESQFIIEYHMSQVSRLELDADSSKLIVTLHNPPKFYICGLMNQEDSMNEGLDFTAGEELSRFPAHAILRPVSVDRGEFKRLKDWLHNQATRPEQDAAEWYATRQAVELAEPYQNTGASVSPLGVFVNPAMGLKGHEDTSLEHVINANTERWIQSVDPNPSSANTLENIPLTSDEDNMLTASEGLSWSSESEYFAALTTAKRQRVSRHSLGLNNNSSAGQWRPLPDLPVPWVNREVGRGGITIPPKKSSRQPHWLVRGAQSLVNRFGLEEAADGGITDKSRQTPGQDLKDQHIISRTDTLDSANRQVGKRGITQQGTSTSPQQHSLPPHELITRGKPEEAESPELQVTEGRNTDKSRQVLEDGDFTDQDNKSQPDTLESTNLEAGRKRETAEQGTATSPRRPPRRPHWLIRNAQSLVNRLELEKGDRP